MAPGGRHYPRPSVGSSGVSQRCRTDVSKGGVGRRVGNYLFQQETRCPDGNGRRHGGGVDG